MRKAAEILEIPATITERGQTTVPAAIRKMLDLGKRGHVVFRGLADGTVVIAKRDSVDTDDDPVIGKFLSFLARDIANQPQRIRPLSRNVLDHAKGLVDGVAVDLERALPDDDE